MIEKNNKETKEKSIDEYLSEIKQNLSDYKKTGNIEYNIKITNLIGELTPKLMYMVADCIEQKNKGYCLADIEAARDCMVEIHRQMKEVEPLYIKQSRKENSNRNTQYAFIHQGNNTIH